MSATDPVETAVLELIFNAAAWADIAQNDGSSPATNLYVSLHTADPGEGGLQTTSETAYTGYARQEVARTNAGWVVSNSAVSNAAAITFPVCTASPGGAVTHVGIGTAVSGDGAMLFVIALSASITVAISSAPYFDVGGIVITCD